MGYTDKRRFFFFVVVIVEELKEKVCQVGPRSADQHHGQKLSAPVIFQRFCNGIFSNKVEDFRKKPKK